MSMFSAMATFGNDGSVDRLSLLYFHEKDTVKIQQLDKLRGMDRIRNMPQTRESYIQKALV